MHPCEPASVQIWPAATKGFGTEEGARQHQRRNPKARQHTPRHSTSKDALIFNLKARQQTPQSRRRAHQTISTRQCHAMAAGATARSTPCGRGLSSGSCGRWVGVRVW
eukprot:5719587-Prymnesium_polylepis.1